MSELLAVTLSVSDWGRVIQALRNEAHNLTLESQRACEKGCREYGTLLWEECAIHNDIASDIDLLMPHDSV